MIRYAKSDGDKARNKSYQETSHADKVYYGDSPEQAQDYHYAPGKILAFVDMGQGQTSAVVMCCAFKHIHSSVITNHWKLEFADKQCKVPQVLLIDVNAIVRHCCMMPENKKAHGFHELWEKERWADEFT